MGNGMNKILPGLFIGNFRDAKDLTQLEENNITHVLSIHDNAKPIHTHLEYLCLIASDTPGQELKQFFPQCVDFIHTSRLAGGNVLVHCLAGVSRSVTVTVAYLMTHTSFGWRDALNAIRGSRQCANPNFGFQKQLMEYECNELDKARKQFDKKYPNNHLRENDLKELKKLRDQHWKWVLNGDEVDNTYQLEANAYKTVREDTANRTKSANDKPNSMKHMLDVQNSVVESSSTPLPFDLTTKTVSKSEKASVGNVAMNCDRGPTANKVEQVAKKRGSCSVEDLLGSKE